MLHTDKYIYKIEDHEANQGDLAGYSSGWYFVDETEQFQGPFSSRQEALYALAHYEL